MKLTKDFSYEEMFVSESFPDLALKCWQNEHDNKLFQERAKKLFQEILQPTRDYLGKILEIDSGYRDKFLNKAVGGVATSDHTLCLAVDLKGDFDKRDLYYWMKDNTCYRQLYYCPAKNILHCSVNDVDIVPYQHRAWIKGE